MDFLMNEQGRVERDESRHRMVSGPARPSALAPFRVRNYRFQWPADLLTSWAFEMETLILGWYVLVETGSVLLLTLFASLTYVGTLIAPMFGVVGDRIGHRDLLAMMRATYAVLAATLMTLALTGYLTPLYVFVIAALMGLVRPSDLGVRGALVADIMPHDQLIGAISISRTTMDTARIAGALSGAGLFAALGMGPAYMAIVSLYVVATLLTLCVVAPRETASRRCRGGRRVAALAAARPEGRRGLCLDHAADARARSGSRSSPISPRIRCPTACCPISRARSTAPTRPGLAIWSASFAVGSLVGSILLSVIGGVRVARLMIVATVMWYASLLMFAQMQTRAAGDRLPGAGGLHAEPDHDLDRGDPDAHRERAFPRPGDGRAHAGDLQPADRPCWPPAA